MNGFNAKAFWEFEEFKVLLYGILKGLNIWVSGVYEFVLFLILFSECLFNSGIVKHVCLYLSLFLVNILDIDLLFLVWY